MTDKKVIVVEDDWFTRIFQVLLDPTCSDERRAAFADFFAHDLPDFNSYCSMIRELSPALYPANVRLVKNQEELNAALPEADILIIESFSVGVDELNRAPQLRILQKFGSSPRGIDLVECQNRNIEVLLIDRKSTAACAEMVVAFMLVLGKQINRWAGHISIKQMEAAGQAYKPFDRRHTANSNWARIPGFQVIAGSRVGIIGVGEIGKQVVNRLSGFSAHLFYHQRTRLPKSEEEAFNLVYCDLESLLKTCDWIILTIRSDSDARFCLLGQRELSLLKTGAFLINISRADYIDRSALLEALHNKRLGGFALDTQYETPGREDDELLSFPNVVLTPHIAAQPRTNVLSDLQTMVIDLQKNL